MKDRERRRLESGRNRKEREAERNEEFLKRKEKV